MDQEQTWSIEEFEDRVLSKLHDHSLIDRTRAILDVWHRYTGRWDSEQTPGALANILFWRLADWVARGEGLPHPALTRDEVERLLVTAVSDDAVRKAARKVHANLEALGASHSETFRDADFRFLIGGLWHFLRVTGPDHLARGDQDPRLWLRPTFVRDERVPSMGYQGLQPGRAPITLQRPADWCYLRDFGVVFGERVPRVFSPSLTLDEMVDSNEAQTVIRSLLATGDGYLTGLHGRDGLPICSVHTGESDSHHWDDGRLVRNGCSFETRSNTLHVRNAVVFDRDRTGAWMDSEVALSLAGVLFSSWYIVLGEQRPPASLNGLRLEFIIPRRTPGFEDPSNTLTDDAFLERVATMAGTHFSVQSRESRAIKVKATSDLDLSIGTSIDPRFGHVSFEFRKCTPISAEELQRQTFAQDFQRLLAGLAFPFAHAPRWQPPESERNL